MTGGLRLVVLLGGGLILVAVAGCWPRDNPYDPNTCRPPCSGGQQCFNGRCLPIDASTADASTIDVGADAPRQDGPKSDGPKSDSPKSDSATPDLVSWPDTTPSYSCTNLPPEPRAWAALTQQGGSLVPTWRVRAAAPGPSNRVHFTGHSQGSPSACGATISNNVLIAGAKTIGATPGSCAWFHQVGYGGHSHALVVDAAGNTWIGGSTYGSSLYGALSCGAASGPYIFVAKLDTTGAFKALSCFKSDGLVSALVAAPSGGVFAAGHFRGTVDFKVKTSTAKGNPDAFVARLTASGSVSWMTHGSTAWSAGVYGLAVSGNNVYATGTFTGSMTLGNAKPITGKSSSDAFAARLDPASGSVTWAVPSAGAGGYNSGDALAVGTGGDLYLAGRLQTQITWGTTPLAHPAAFYVAKLDSSGKPKWAVAGPVGGSNFFLNRVLDVSVDPAGQGYLVGLFESSATFGGKTLTKGTYAYRPFVAQVSPAGSFTCAAAW